MSINERLNDIKKKLNAELKEGCRTKVLTLYACNASGKTRLSTLFYENDEERVLCYNAFTEDLFSWDNKDYVLKINPDASTPNAGILKTIRDQGLDRQIIENFQKFTGSKLEPDFDLNQNQITFTYPGSNKNIKISRGEESVFIWSVFYTVLDTAIKALNETPENRSTNDFDDIRYVVIDDPVSSMDDTRIITIALELVKLISKSNKNSKPDEKLKFLITTHHALFFNVLFNTPYRQHWDSEAYILSKRAEAEEYNLEEQSDKSPFAYHHVIMSEIKEASDNDNLKKYHFNLFRALLEKTDNFLGYSKDHWKKRLKKNEHNEHGEAFIRTLNHYSHDSLSDLEPGYLPENDKEHFKKAFNSFLEEFNFPKKYKVNND